MIKIGSLSYSEIDFCQCCFWGFGMDFLCILLSYYEVLSLLCRLVHTLTQGKIVQCGFDWYLNNNHVECEHTAVYHFTAFQFANVRFAATSKYSMIWLSHETIQSFMQGILAFQLMVTALASCMTLDFSLLCPVQVKLCPPVLIASVCYVASFNCELVFMA